MKRLLIALTLGWVLGVVQPAAANTVHTVASGEVLGTIAQRYGVSIAELQRWNPGLNPDRISVGQRLQIRGGTAAGQAPTHPSGYREHVVAAGETAGAIARRYGVSIEELVSWNRGLNPDRIREGQRLRVQGYGRITRQTRYLVQPGDTAGAIARRHNVTVNQLVSWNRGLNPDRIREGQELVLHVQGPETPSASIGRANDGRLVNGEQLPPHRAYVIRDPARAWGTNQTIGAILGAFDYMQQQHGRSLPRLRVHDISRQHGGDASGHRSHESGRDADIGIYYTGCRRQRDCEYRRIRPEEFDSERNWQLLNYWIRNNLVDYIFLDYNLQRPLHDYLVEQGMSRAELQRLLQYPRGRDSRAGLIRHEPHHADHFHVRFSCAREDRQCR